MSELDSNIRKISDFIYEVSMESKAGMRVPGRIVADWQLLQNAISDKGLEQVENVAFLPGIVKASFAMPDIHWGYGFPIGGVAALDAETGVVSPGGVGFDINCGVRLIRTNITVDELEPRLTEVMDVLSRTIPKGVGQKGKIILSDAEMRELLRRGVPWVVEQGFGWEEDIEFTEEGGALAGADPDKVSSRAYERGRHQLGSLGAGNHFLEVQAVAEVLDDRVAEVFGLHKDQVVVMIHSGSRGVGHQICTDHVRALDMTSKQYGIELPDRQLACAPINSKEGRDYLAAMAAAVNYAFANRHCLAHWTRKAFETVLGTSARELGMSLVYDVAHNIAKFEDHVVNEGTQRLLVHRKGATRAFGPGQPSLPEKYRAVGQPVLIPGDMGTFSYVLVGTEQAMKETFGTTCHGAGRRLSRSAAKKQIQGRVLRDELEKRGIRVRAGNIGLLAEEAPDAYKDVTNVVDVCEGAGISHKVARLRPLGVVKG